MRLPFLRRGTDAPSSLIAEEALASARREPQVCGNRHANLYHEEGLSDWLRRKYPTSTGANVEADTGIPSKTVDNWLWQRSRPTVEYFAVLVAFYGPALMAACLNRPTDWLERAKRTERVVEIDETMAQLQRERERLSQA